MVLKPAYRHLTAARLQTRLENGDRPTLVDVRTPSEYFAYHIENTLLIPIDEFASRCQGELTPDDEIVLICEHGVRSEMAAQYLASLGFGNAATMDGGMAGVPGRGNGMANSTEHVERPMVRTQEDLLTLVADLKAAGRFALDTEFLADRTYVPKLCLIQVATDDFIALIDSIAVPSLVPFWELVNDPDVGKVLHAAREDLRLSYYGSRDLPRNIFDTQVAAGLIGLPQ